MLDKFTELGNILKRNWNQLTPTKRSVFVGTGLGLIGLFTFIIFYTSKIDYTYLFTNLDPEAAGKIVEQLKKENADYKIAAGGSAIMVPAERVHELRLAVTKNGIPGSGGVGFELFDKGTMGMTEFIQRLNYKRALQGELSRTISSIDGIDNARVHIVLPERTLFREERNKARASVYLRLKDNNPLSREQTNAIVNLVGSSIKELKTNAITIVDHRGNVLKRAADSAELEEDIRDIKDPIEYQTRYEKKLEEKVTLVLEQILGPAKAVVKVAADFNFNRVDERKEEFNPDVQVVRSEQLTEEVNSSTGAAAGGGVPGAEGNQPGADEAAAGGAQNETAANRNVTVRNYEIERTVKTTAHAVGVLQRLSVAVTLDGTYEKDKDGNVVYKERDAAEIKKLEEVIKNAVGFSINRKDQVVVETMQFEYSDDLSGQELAKTIRQERFISLAVRYGLMLLMAGLITMVLYKLVNFITSPEVEEMLPGFPKTLDELEEIEEEEEEDDVDLEEMRRIQEEERQKILAQQKASRVKIQELSTRNPAQTAEIIKNWLVEDEEDEADSGDKKKEGSAAQG